MYMVKAFNQQVHYEGHSAALAAVSVPTLFLCGAADQLTPPEMAREAAAAIPEGLAAVRTLDRSGHMMMLEQEEDATRLLVEHLDACLSGTFEADAPAAAADGASAAGSE